MDMETKDDPAFGTLLEESVRIHGHLCPGQVLGVRMAMLGLREAGISDPRGADRKRLIVFVEMDRCATDAVQSVTGTSLGKRSMKFMDMGKMAATFVNLATRRAVRIFALEESKEVARGMFPGIEDKYKAQLEAYKVMPDATLFSVTPVNVTLRPEDMPGRPTSRVKCAVCGEHVQDRRERMIEGLPHCAACAGEGYYTKLPPSEKNLASVMPELHNDPEGA